MLHPALIAAALAAERFDGLDFYFGDLHVHTAASADGRSADMGEELGRSCPEGGCGAVSELAKNARDRGLDFFAVADHVNGNPVGDPALFERVFRGALAAEGPEMLVVPAAEVHFVMPKGHPLGHKNLYLFGERAKIESFRWEDARFNGDDYTVEGCEQLWEWARALEGRFGPLLLIPHQTAPSAPMPSDWGCHDPAFQPAVEVYSHHGSSLSSEPDYDPPFPGIEPSGAVHYALKGLGLELGFIGSTDNHQTLPGEVCTSGEKIYGGGLAAVALAAGAPFDRAALYEAILARQTYATSGPRVPVTVQYQDAAGRVYGMGDRILLGSNLKITAELRLPPEVEPEVLGVELITSEGPESFTPAGGGLYLYETESPADWFYPRVRIDGASWYAPSGCADNGDDEEQLWLSPTYVTRPVYAAGCALLSGGAAPSLALLAALLVSARYLSGRRFTHARGAAAPLHPPEGPVPR